MDRLATFLYWLYAASVVYGAILIGNGRLVDGSWFILGSMLLMLCTSYLYKLSQSNRTTHKENKK